MCVYPNVLTLLFWVQWNLFMKGEKTVDIISWKHDKGIRTCSSYPCTCYPVCSPSIYCFKHVYNPAECLLNLVCVCVRAHTLDKFSVNKDIGNFYEKSVNLILVFTLDWMNLLTALCENIIHSAGVLSIICILQLTWA
jgi:hypothetical protein